MAYSLEYNFLLSQYKHNQINHAISSQVENKNYTFKSTTFPILGAIFCSIERLS